MVAMSTLRGSYGKSKDWVRFSVLALTCGFRLRRLAHEFLFQLRRPGAKSGWFQRGRLTRPGVCAHFQAWSAFCMAFGSLKHEFAWKLQRIRHVSEDAMLCGRFQGVAKELRLESLEGLHFIWQAQWVRTMDVLFSGRRARFLRRVTLLELEHEDEFAWPAQHFLWPQVIISRQARYFWNMPSKFEPSAEIVRIDRMECW